MASAFSFSPSFPGLAPIVRPRRRNVLCCSEPRQTSSGGDEGSRSENALLKVAWYGSELLGIAASFFRPTRSVEELPVTADVSEKIDRTQAVEAIKQDFQRSYFVTGNLTLNAYEDDCEFADPAGSFRGLQRFQRNCSNFGSLLLKTDMNLTKWEHFEMQDKGVGHWRFRSVMIFPWRPILSATGYTEYFFDGQSGRVCRHVEHWNVPKMALLKQIFRPSRWVWENS